MGVRGSQKFAVLLCNFEDTQNVAPPFSADYFQNLVVNRGTGGLNDYWVDASLGSINLDGSRVFDWKTVQQTQADFIDDHPDRWDKVQGAIDAHPEMVPSDYIGFIAFFNVSLNDGGTQSPGILTGLGDATVTWLAHETGHVFNLDHSYDQSDRKIIVWSQPGEYYDKYDIMSAMNVYRRKDKAFTKAGPLVNVGNLDQIGWLPSSRIWFSPQAGHSYSQTIDLVSLSCPEIPGFLAAKIGDYYFEYRTQDRWDAGIPRDTVLIHRMMGVNSVIMESGRPNIVSVDILHPGRGFWNYEWLPGQVFGPENDLDFNINGGTRVTIESFDPQNKTARIQVNHRVTRSYVDGPAQIFGGVKAGGDGWVILPDGRRIPIPPHSPYINVLEMLAVAVEAEQQPGLEDSQEATRAQLSAAVQRLQKMGNRLR